MPEPTPPEPKSENGRVLRTMRSDVEQFLKAKKPSLTSILSEQVASDGPVQEPFFSRRLLITIFIVVGVVIAGGGAAVYFVLRSSQSKPPALPNQAPAPPDFVYFEATKEYKIALTKTALLTAIQNAAGDTQQTSPLVRLIFREDNPATGNPILTLEQFFSILASTPPSGLTDTIDGTPQFFIYYSRTGPRFGFMATAKNPARAMQAFITWEPSIQSRISPLLLDANATSTLDAFTDATYRNIDYRYLAIATTTDLGIGYLQFEANSRIVMTTSLAETRILIDRLFEK